MAMFIYRFLNILFFFLTVGVTQLRAQNIIKSDLIQNERSINLFLDQQKNVTEGNTVVVEQVGNNNITYSFTFTGKNELRLFQYGDDNEISVLANARKLEGEIVQNGYNNYSFDFVHDSRQDLEIGLIQEGNNHHFERHGSNSIGNHLKFKMSGDSNSIIVRNFK